MVCLIFITDRGEDNTNCLFLTPSLSWILDICMELSKVCIIDVPDCLKFILMNKYQCKIFICTSLEKNQFTCVNRTVIQAKRSHLTFYLRSFCCFPFLRVSSSKTCGIFFSSLQKVTKIPLQGKTKTIKNNILCYNSFQLFRKIPREILLNSPNSGIE